MYKSKQYLIFVGLSVVIGNICYSFSLNSMNNALHQMLEVFDISSDDEGLIKGILTSSVSFGCLLGAIMNLFFNRINIRYAIMLGDTLLLCGTILLMSNNLFIFVGGRVLTGMGGGVVAVFTSLYLKQISPTELYGLLGGLYPIVFSTAVILTQTYGLLFLVDDFNGFWRFYFAVPAIFSVIRLILMSTFVTFTTPFNYFQLKKQSKGIAVIDTIYKDEYKDIVYTEINGQSKKKERVDLLAPKYRKRVFLAFSLQILFQFCGLNAMLQYSTDIFKEIIGKQFAIYLTLSISLLKVICYSSATVLATRYGKRTVFLYGNGAQLVFNILITITTFLIENMGYKERYLEILEIVLIFGFLISNFLSLGPLIPVYMPEIVPQKAVSASWIFHWAGNVFITLTFPIVKDSVGMSYIFMGYVCVIMIGQVIIYIFAVETTDRTDSQIDRLFVGKQILGELLIQKQ